MTIPTPREHDPNDQDAGEVEKPPAPDRRSTAARYPATTIYVSVMVTLILLAVLFDWRL